MVWKIDRAQRKVVSEKQLSQGQRKAFRNAIDNGVDDSSYILFEHSWWFVEGKREGRYTLYKAYQT